MQGNRREFLKKFTLLSTVACAPTFLARSVMAARNTGMMRAALGNPNRIMVVIELAGGNDGLSTVIPYTNDIYKSSRPALGLANAPGLHTLDSELALHPAMSSFKELWDSDRLSIVQGVGYPNPNRSHFRSRDIWHTAEPEAVASDGWLASYFDLLESENALVGLNIGGQVPRAMISEEGSAPSMQNITTYQLQTDPLYPGDAANKTAAFQQMLAEPQNRFPFQEYVGQTVLDATTSSIELLEGRDNYQSTIEYPNTAFGGNLRTVAQIIAADLGVTVFYTRIGGFDTHANQIVTGNNLLGAHATLLTDVSDTVKAFFDDMVEIVDGVRFQGDAWHSLQTFKEAGTPVTRVLRVAGTTFRRAAIEQVVQEGVTSTQLVPDPTNAHDPNAVKVLVNGWRVGYVPRGEDVPTRAAVCHVAAAPLPMVWLSVDPQH